MRKQLFKLLHFAVIVVMASCSSNNDLDVQVQPTSNARGQSLEKELGTTIANLEGSFLVSRSGTNDDIYPSYYGGSYVNEHKQLVILSKNANKYRDEFIVRTKATNILVEDCEFSLSELVLQLKKLDSLLKDSNYQSLFDNLQVKSHAIRLDKNRIVIGLADCSTQNIANFKSQVMDSPMFIYEPRFDGVEPMTQSSFQNLMDHILDGPNGEYFEINKYTLVMGAAGCDISNASLYLRGKSYPVSYFVCANTNPSNIYDYRMYMYTNTSMSNQYDAGNGRTGYNMNVFNSLRIATSGGIKVVAINSVADQLSNLFRF